MRPLIQRSQSEPVDSVRETQASFNAAPLIMTRDSLRFGAGDAVSPAPSASPAAAAASVGQENGQNFHFPMSFDFSSFVPLQLKPPKLTASNEKRTNVGKPCHMASP